MSEGVYNFSSGPAMLPREVLEASAAALVDYQGRGLGIAEVSHRGEEFLGVLHESVALARELLTIPDTQDVVYLQGGATQLFATIPMNFLGKGKADYVVSGEWSQKAFKMARSLFGERVRAIASSDNTNFDRPPTGWAADSHAAYLHVCSNETVQGHRLLEWPQHPNLIVDASSEIMSRPHPAQRTALIYAGAQKNLAPAGLVMVIVRKDLLERVPIDMPSILSFKAHAEANSCLNTPPTFGVYVLLESLRWIKRQGGLVALEKKNTEKAKLIYDVIDNSSGFYRSTVGVPAARSHMNVTFRLPDEQLTEVFLKQAAARRLVNLKGHRTVGGIRASIYNAMPLDGCQALADHMREFIRVYG